MSESDSISLEATRRRLTDKQADTVDRLTKAALRVLARDGFSGMTIRLVAAEAGVGTATAYTYFSSKEHLVAEIFWRRLLASRSPASEDPDSTVRVLAELRNIALLVADEQELSGAVTSALLGGDPDVEHLRTRIGIEIRGRIARALGPDADEEVIEWLEMIYAGALVRAGMGYESYSKIADRIERAALRILQSPAAD
ncbi:TetR/AcrR family transcriptional regulator [Nocardia rhizosphaerihabitans]|uniref:TetR family transcriptional regulator n=1 Tax=Nocardia rhizosphaerihabitans TaxID=1691570 RepID=A0ABQ2KHQ0_9NOCA|nr:TetR/AcrR family transcriptional regulator [Nocardia rhizosphaerihabitans]GGN82269.1 TetR family transcriptional regulator [Nocardia rhizosphaerihabitans]